MLTSPCSTLNNLCSGAFRLLLISSARSGRVWAARPSGVDALRLELAALDAESANVATTPQLVDQSRLRSSEKLQIFQGLFRGRRDVPPRPGSMASRRWGSVVGRLPVGH